MRSLAFFGVMVPAAALVQGGNLEHARQRQGKVPDLAYRLPVTPGAPPPHPDGQRAPPRRGQQHPPQNRPGQTTRQLAEIKIIGAGPSRYPRGSRDKAVDRRARALPGEYRNSLAKLDQQYHGTAVGHQGPLGARFEELCGDSGLQNLVVGRFGESSEHLHLLIKGMAEARALFVSRSAGRPLSDNETGVILASYRRILSCRFIKSQESCLLARLGHMDEGARQAGGRRRLRMREEEMARHEAAAYHTAYVRGRGVHRAGQLPRGPGR